MSLTSNSDANGRKKTYKLIVDPEDARRKREDSLVQIRKNKRKDYLKKRRQENQEIKGAKYLMDNLSAMVTALWSDDSSSQLQAASMFRELLSNNKNPPIEQIIQTGVIPRFIQFLTWPHIPEIQYEAAWTLTNITSGTSHQAKVVLDHGALPVLIHIVEHSPSDDVRELAIWVLGNLAGDSVEFRDRVLDEGALNVILTQLNQHTPISIFRIVSWTLSNLWDWKPRPSFGQIKPAIEIMEKLIDLPDMDVLTETCWFLSCLTEENMEGIEAVTKAGLCRRLIELLQHPSPKVVCSVLQTLGNIVAGDDVHKQLLVNNEVLACLLRNLTYNHEKRIEKKACRVISYIITGGQQLIQAVIYANIFSALVQMLQAVEFEVKALVAWTISVACIGSSEQQIKHLVSVGSIKALCDLLEYPYASVVEVCLTGLESILKAGEAEREFGDSGVNVYAVEVVDCEGLEKIESLQYHENDDLYEKAVNILETYWSDFYVDNEHFVIA